MRIAFSTILVGKLSHFGYVVVSGANWVVLYERLAKLALSFINKGRSQGRFSGSQGVSVWYSKFLKAFQGGPMRFLGHYVWFQDPLWGLQCVLEGIRAFQGVSERSRGPQGVSGESSWFQRFFRDIK